MRDWKRPNQNPVLACQKTESPSPEKSRDRANPSPDAGVRREWSVHETERVEKAESQNGPHLSAPFLALASWLGLLHCSFGHGRDRYCLSGQWALTSNAKTTSRAGWPLKTGKLVILTAFQKCPFKKADSLLPSFQICANVLCSTFPAFIGSTWNAQIAQMLRKWIFPSNKPAQIFAKGVVPPLGSVMPIFKKNPKKL